MANPTQREVQDAAVKWIEERWGKKRACPVCGKDDWGVGESLGLKPWPAPDATWYLDAPGIYPVIPIVCRNCGSTEFLNGVVAGIFPARKA